MDEDDLIRLQLQIALERNCLRKAPELHYLFFELTDQCNLQCMHCGSSCSAQNKQFLDPDKVKEIIKNAAVLEPRVHIVLTGGEPLLYPEFDEIISVLKQKGLYWSVVSNAMLVTDETAKKLSDHHIYSVSVSLDGSEYEHNRLRRNSHAYEQAVRGIRILRQNDIYTQITSVITKRTLQDLDALYKTVRELNVTSWKVLNIEPIGRAEENRDLLLDKNDLFYLFDYIKRHRAEEIKNQSGLDITYGCSHFLPGPYEGEIRTTPFICGSGIMIESIRSNGDISGCLDLERRNELVQGNVYQDDFWDVWLNRFEIFRKDRIQDSPKCSECKYGILCAGDSFHTWDLDRKKPKMCLMETA